MKTGRNDPCQCGSGIKYKRCCLSRDEFAQRESSQRTLWDEEDQGVDCLIDEDGELGEPPVLDVDDVRRVRYEHGFVKNLKRALSGRGLQSREWTAPSIPPAILDSVEPEGRTSWRAPGAIRGPASRSRSSPSKSKPISTCMSSYLRDALPDTGGRFD